MTPTREKETADPSEKRRREVAEQITALMQRHGVNSAELERMTAAAGGRVTQVTIRRIKNAEGQDEPDLKTLQKIATAVGESFENAFPDSREADRIIYKNHNVALKWIGQGPVPGGLADRVRDVIADYDPTGLDTLDKTKKSGRRGKKR